MHFPKKLGKPLLMSSNVLSRDGMGLAVNVIRYGSDSFSFQAAKLWNALPEEARNPLLMSSNVLSRDGMGLAVNVICVNDLPMCICQETFT